MVQGWNGGELGKKGVEKGWNIVKHVITMG